MGDIERYTSGQCHALALAIVAERPEWRIGEEWGQGAHIVAVRIDGIVLDVRGARRSKGVREAREERWKKAGVWEKPLLDEHTKGLARRLLEENGL